MWQLDHIEGWAPKNWCYWTVVPEKTLESPLDRKEIKPVNPKGNQPWIFIGRTDAEAEAPTLWPPNSKSWLIGKDSVKDWGQEKRARGWGSCMASPTQWTWVWANSEIVKDREVWHAAVHGISKNQMLATYNNHRSYLILMRRFWSVTPFFLTWQNWAQIGMINM